MTLNRWPHTTQARGEMKSRILVHQFVFIADVNTLFNNIVQEPPAQREATEFAVHVVFIGGLGRAALLFQQGAQYGKILLVIDFVKNLVADVVADVFDP